MLATTRTPAPGIQDTHHHHGDPDAYRADDVEFVVEDLFDGFRAGLRGQTETLVTHTPCSGHTPSPQGTHFTQVIGGSRERVGARSVQVPWLVDGKKNQERHKKVGPLHLGKKSWKRGKSLLWVYFLSGVTPYN